MLQTQENFAAESRQILLTLLRDSIDDVCDYTFWWLSETDDFCVWTEDESQRWDLHKPEALYDFITGEYGRAEHICGKNFVTVSILLDADVKEQLNSFCDEHDTTPGQILTTALEWMVHHPEEAPDEGRYIMRKEELNLETLHTVTPEEFQQHFDVLTEEARTGNVPLRIRTEDGSSDLLLFAWDDFFERFHEIYPSEKRAEIEAACQAFNESE